MSDSGSHQPRSDQRPLLAAYVLHSPSVTSNRAAHANALAARVRPLVAPGGPVEKVTYGEPRDIAHDVGRLADLDPTHMPDPAWRPHMRNMHVRQLSCALKHLEALRSVAALEEKDGYALILEDDCLCGDEMEDAIRAVIDAAPSDTGVIMLGLPSPAGTRASPKSPIFIDADNVLKGAPLPACDSYLVRPAAASALAAAWLPVRLPANLQLARLAGGQSTATASAAGRLVVCAPNVFVDGSKLGAFVCSVDATSKLVWNQLFCQCELLLAGERYGPGEAAEYERLAAQQPFLGHPDVLAQRATHLERLGRHAEAEAAYNKALNTYDGVGALITGASAVLRGCMRVHRHLQIPPPPPAPHVPDALTALA